MLTQRKNTVYILKMVAYNQPYYSLAITAAGHKTPAVSESEAARPWSSYIPEQVARNAVLIVRSHLLVKYNSSNRFPSILLGCFNGTKGRCQLKVWITGMRDDDD